MGVRASTPLCWIDIEGGMRGIPVWDFAIVHELPPPASLTATRIINFQKPNQAKRVKNSVPSDVYEAMAPNETWKLTYSHSADNGWEVAGSSKAPKGANVATMVQAEIPANCVVAAWNMMAHDAKILKSMLGDEAMKTVTPVDPLRFFKKHINLPSNTLGSAKPGTPRNVMKAGTYTGLGGAHTALVDTLHMRDVTQKAALAVHRALKTDSQIDIDDVHDKEASEYFEALMATVFDVKPKQPANAPQAHGEPWMWTNFYWDKVTLRPDRSKEFKRKLVGWMQANGVEVTKNMRMAINAAKKQETMRRYTERQWTVVQKKDPTT